MNYIGSKLSLLDFIFDGAKFLLAESKDSREIEELIFCDIFAGTGIVGCYFKEKGLSIIANDMQYYSYVLNNAYLNNNILPENINKWINHLNALEIKKEGFIYKNYSLEGTMGQEFERMYFSDENAAFCDTARNEIERLFNTQQITKEEYYYLLASLLESIDKYANTASVYGAFLKKLKKSASKKAVIEPFKITIKGKKNSIYQEDACTLINKIKGDILYLDPPYNARQYCDNYHILETIAKNDQPEIKGKTGLRLDNKQQKSKFCYKRNAKEVFEYIIQHAKFKYIILSYNDEGIIDIQDIEEIMGKYGTYYQLKKEYKRFRASVKEVEKKTTIEYLHCLIKHP